MVWTRMTSSIKICSDPSSRMLSRFSEERLNATRTLLEEDGCAVPVSKKGYVVLVQQSTEEVEEARWKYEAGSPELAERDGKVKELNLTVRPFADDSEKVERLRAQIASKVVELTTSCVAAS